MEGGGAWDMGHGSMDDKARMQRELVPRITSLSLSFSVRVYSLSLLSPSRTLEDLQQGSDPDKGNFPVPHCNVLCIWWSPGPLLGALGRNPREVGTNLLLKKVAVGAGVLVCLVLRGTT